jgi:hypothetical protein
MMAPELLSRGLADVSHTERLALAEALGKLLEAGPPAPSQLLTRTVLTIFWGMRQLQRGLAEAQPAIALAREVNDRFTLYILLSHVSYNALRVGDAELAAASLAEMHAIEDPAWPPHRLFWGAEADALCVAIGVDDGSAAASLPLWRKAIALVHAAGDSVHALRNSLVDSELAAGEVTAAVASGRALVEDLQLARDEYALVMARANLVAALLAQGDVAAARPVAEAGWAQAVGFDVQAAYADYLSLMAALERRWPAAARLAGYATADYARQNSPRWPTEARAFERATALARAALGPAEFDRVMAEGALLRDAQITAIAFGTEAGD